MAALTTIAAIAGIASAAASIGGSLTHKKPKGPQLPPAPDPNADALAAAQAATAAGAKRKQGTGSSGRAGTILTGPDGASDAAPVERKTLLGL
jgi:hypothetical protein